MTLAPEIEKIDTVERLVPATIDPNDRLAVETYTLHQERYVFAGQHMKPGHVLDIACGVGYGSAYLATLAAAESVTGVDLSAEAITYARTHYISPKTNFICQNAVTFTAASLPRTIVSLETIEHVPDLAGFLDMVARNLAADGVFITSVPLGITSDINPHHVHDFTEASFRAMMEKRGFRQIAEMRQTQHIKWRDLLTQDKSRLSKLRPGLPLYYLRHPGQLLRRVIFTLRHGLNAYYLVTAWERRVKV